MSKWLYVNKKDFCEKARQQAFSHMMLNLDSVSEVMIEPGEHPDGQYTLKVVLSEGVSQYEFKDEATCRSYFAKIQGYLFPDLQLDESTDDIHH